MKATNVCNRALRCHTSRVWVPGFALALSLTLGAVAGCDKGSSEAGKAGEAAESENAKNAKAAAAKIKAELEKGEDVKYSCVAELSMHEALATSKNEAEKAAYAELTQLCHVEVPRKLIAELRTKLENGELGTTDTIDLSVMIESEDFPKDGEPAKVAEEAKKLLEVEIPTHELEAQLAEAAKEKAAGETVSMGCISAKQIVEDSGKVLEGDAAGKAALDKFKTMCPDE